MPPAEEELIQSLNGLNTLWEYQLTLSTFILTFFTQARARARARARPHSTPSPTPTPNQQAYAYWRGVYFTTRAIQVP